MISTKGFSFFFVFLLLAGFAGAVSISSPSKVPENSSWVFSVDLEPNTDAVVKFNGSEVAKVFSSGSVALLSKDVASAHLYSGDLVVQFTGLAAGTYTLSVESGGSDSKQLTVVPLADTESVLADIDVKVNERLSKFDEINQRVSNMEVDNKEFWNKLNQTSDNVSGLDSKISGLDSSVSALSGKVDGSTDSLDSKLAALEEKVSVLEGFEQARLDEAKKMEQAKAAAAEQAKKNPLTGFVTFASGNILPFFAVGIIILIAVLGFVFREQIMGSIGTSVYSSKSSFDENNLPLSREEEEMAADVSEQKFAFKP